MKEKKRNKGKSKETFEFGDDLAEPTPKWFENVVEDPKKFQPVTEELLVQLKDEAKKCNDSEALNYKIKNSKTNSNYKSMKTLMSNGTVSDKVAAYIVTIQDNPVFNLETLHSLVGMVKAGKKKECMEVIGNLTELFLTDLLKPDQKLKAFHQRPLSLLNELSSGNAVTRRKLLSVWYFEDQLKEVYTSYVLALNNVARDTIESNKEKAISAMFELLAGNPEQEKNLLTHLVNKLGDPSQKVASKAIYNLNKLLVKHPNMQGVVLNEVEKLMFRSNVSTKTQYYGLCFLSQFCLSHESSEVARKLIEVYFAFFKACVKKGEVDSRMMSALLMGVNRAYPYAKLEMEKISDHIETMYRVVHLADFNISIHALTLLYQVSDYGNNISNRFYSALYRKLSDLRLLNTSHQAMFLSLVYKALLKDPEIARVRTFAKTLLTLALSMQSTEFACGILYLISQLMGKKENVLAFTSKQTVLSGLEDDNDEEERYYDIKEEEEVEGDSKTEEQMEIDSDEDVKPDIEVLNASTSKASWYHCQNTKTNQKKSTQYVPLDRNPLYAGGEFCAYTELQVLTERPAFHPTVSLYAKNILEGEVIKYSGDPLKDFTLIRFLDRFVFKNPKKSVENSGAHPIFGKRKTYTPKGLKSLPVNSLNYLNEDRGKIPADELFMHSYLQNNYKEKPEREEEEYSDVESVNSEEFNEMLEKENYLGMFGEEKKKKKKKGDEESGDDLLSGDEDDLDDEELDEDDLELDEDDLELDEDDLELDEDDLEMNEEDEELIGNLDDDDDDDEDIVFDEEPKASKKGKTKKKKEIIEDLDDDEDFLEEEPKTSKKGKGKKKKGDDVMSLFAPVEEFASLLEDEGSSKVAPGGSNVFANRDNADVKQISWEEKRNRRLKGFNKRSGKKLNGHGQKRKHNQGKFQGNKSKRMKK